MYVLRTIKCPRNYILKPGKQPFSIEPNPHFKNSRLTESDCKRFGIKMWRYKKDRYGNKIQDFRNFYQPEITAAYAIEHIYDPLNPICKMQCKGRCLRGIGKVNINSINRLKA
jgi:hypothetical protein